MEETAGKYKQLRNKKNELFEDLSKSELFQGAKRGAGVGIEMAGEFSRPPQIHLH